MAWRLVIFLAALAVALLPRTAAAALVPVCDADELETTMPPAVPACEIVTTVDDTGNERAAPICDPRGASAVAPQRILPVGDARIEAGASGCGTDNSMSALEPRRSSDEPAASAFAVEPATVAMNEVPAAFGGDSLITTSPVTGGARLGHDRRLERPPRRAGRALRRSA